MDEKQRYYELLNALEFERKAEERFYMELSQNNNPAEKIAAGLMIKPLKILRSYYILDEWTELEFENPPDQETTSFKEGKGCFLNSPNLKTGFTGSISYANRKTIRCIFKSDAIKQNDIEMESGLSLELTFDDRPYQVMKSALHQVIKTHKEPHASWKKAISTRKDHTGQTIPPLNIHLKKSPLNEEQREAVHRCFAANSIGIIHGPPGTGKTTTLVAMIKELVTISKPVLVCAPSNNATDLLTQRLSAIGVNVVRAGNITRMDEDVSHLSLDEIARNHSEWNHIKKVKIQAEEIRKKAMTYKRNYSDADRKERKSLLNEASQLRSWALDLEEKLRSTILNKADAICTTLISSALPVLEGMHFSCIIIDEASQALEPECWVAMLKGSKVILAGDPMQLPPTVKSQEAQQSGLAITLLDRLTPVLQTSCLLRRQYRMNDEILHFPNEYFYDGKLYSDESVKFRKISPEDKPVIFIDTAGCGFEEEMNPQNRSWKNEGEYYILREYILSVKECLIGMSIGIISPYAEQVRWIRWAISEDNELKVMDIETDTIDGFQGQEKECIFIVLVRSNAFGEIGFLSDKRRLNVALTRAMKKLVIIGDSITLSSNPLFNDLILFIEKHHSYHSAWEWMKF
ncbi:MAG TPA: AAA domain-containing protein [Saprospiraceae bacterium]|nr:AAA domain-containing protein [Saprospiraceae bacterium]